MQQCRFIPACAGNSRPSLSMSPPKAVHPRVCGELGRPRSLANRSSGSSPRVRGTRYQTSETTEQETVHPRVCGELLRDCGPVCDHSGSSPRVRGTLTASSALPRMCRFIPACAGNSAPARSRGRPAAVHPRVCGELPLDRRRPPGESRFIPACAGNSLRRQRRSDHDPVHPRVCGELATRLFLCHSFSGSSPRVRGTRRGRRCWCACRRVHPRVCGELILPTGMYQIVGGSSPRVRGTPPHHDGHRVQERFIPACAGNSTPRRRRSRLTAVHPRVCGELDVASAVLARDVGSSPRVRGTLQMEARTCATSTVHPRVCGELAARPR